MNSAPRSRTSGIACPEAETRLDVRRNKQGRLTFQGRIGYRGPRQSPGWPRVLLAITNDEPVLDPPVPRSISHSYPDALPVTARVGCYSLEELIAEQTRALIERTRPRDLYDVVCLLDNLAGGVDLTRARDLFARKSRTKVSRVPRRPTLSSLRRHLPNSAADFGMRCSAPASGSAIV